MRVSIAIEQGYGWQLGLKLSNKILRLMRKGTDSSFYVHLIKGERSTSPGDFIAMADIGKGLPQILPRSTEVPLNSMNGIDKDLHVFTTSETQSLGRNDE